jgi:hypothetical protein
MAAEPQYMNAVAVAVLGLALATGAGAQALSVDGSCRDGQPHGAWQLKSADGKPRAIGAFAKGKRTGSFIFWNASGVRVAHVPYEEDAKNGTLALWHEQSRGSAHAQRLEAGYAHGALHGFKRSWSSDGKLRGEYRYESGRLVEASAWDARGRSLPPDAARHQAEAESASDEAYYAKLDALIAANLPQCAANGSSRSH